MIRNAFSALLGLTIATSASASPLMEYNDIDIAYKHTFFDESGLDDGNGLDLGVRISPVEPLFLEVGYEYLATKAESFNLDAHMLTYGGGAYFGCDEDLHFLGRVGGITEWVDPEEGSTEDESGWYIGAEVRAKVADDVELDGSITYSDVKDAELWNFGITTLVALNDRLAVLGAVEINDESDVALLAGLRVGL